MDHESRYAQLDALRGVAALTVVFSHFTLLTPLLGLRHTPLRLICGGHEAVILFFVLSGFVLTLQLARARSPSFGEFIVRRICRIYLPYLGAVCLAYALYVLVFAGSVNWAGEWFNASWPTTLNNADLVKHILFVPPFQSDRLDPVVWSLVYEMRISLVFMPVAFLATNYPTRWSILAAGAGSIAVCALAIHRNHPVIQASVATEWLPTVHYLFMFVAGAALAVRRNEISAVLGGMAVSTRMALVASSLALYVAARPISFLVHGVLSDYLFDWLVLSAVCGIIACAIGIAPFANVLLTKPLTFIGRISYSLYLLHAIVLLGVVHVFGRFGPVVSLTIAALMIVPVSYLSYVCLEQPGIRLG
ncbi:acyltransferase [Paraburkholderia sp. DHOC27]|uniref:acyltransferase family protein n=1 Tax=Paraburkholderia sp. DHOC27 TaxID=2303330 RepID=UPI000E3D34DF|nr:acyltransferase [Paraburkholderia sp. DHOC27]RFU49229.1 acyltransferase [Paraburkholderia sp. DHOC27]